MTQKLKNENSWKILNLTIVNEVDQDELGEISRDENYINLL